MNSMISTGHLKARASGAGKGLDDVAAGRMEDARSAIQSIKRRRNS